ncbi:hypothetical protein EB796_021698 [Bugula neritina]|uniref:Uncharacterized protein n=1 Tax=Bugula neritina TaxID=10212 RepID=A0A7J7J2P0_BUGNE|nr:hypothetical protein EB796_021698 [Bugula neritina]
MLNGKRLLLTHSSLGLNKLKQQIQATRRRLGQNEEEFKTRFLEKLNSNMELFKQECFSYMQLMSREDVSTTVKILARYWLHEICFSAILLSYK